MISSDQEPERRRGGRRRVLLTGLIVHGAEQFTTQCAIRDLSDTGAQVQLSTLVHIVEPAALLVPRLDRAWQIKIARQHGMILGLYFVRKIDLRAPATEEPDKTVCRLWRALPG